MDTIKNTLEKFYKENKDFLAVNYPGLRSHKLIQYFEDFLLFKHASLNFDHEALALNYENEINHFFKEVLKAKPLEYICGYSYFYNSYFLVNEDVLIPRQETELLVEEALHFSNARESSAVLEVGTGSGCIGLSLLEQAKSKIDFIGLDISQSAINVSKMNLERLRYKLSDDRSNCHFICSDYFEYDSKAQFDLIISNPPYIKTTDKNIDVHSNVDKYEPHIALYLDDDKYDKWFSDFFDKAHCELSTSGRLIMEGSENHLDSLSTLALNSGYNKVIIKNDLTNRKRLLIADK